LNTPEGYEVGARAAELRRAIASGTTIDFVDTRFRALVSQPASTAARGERGKTRPLPSTRVEDGVRAGLSVSLLGLSVIPLIMAALRRTERLRRPRARAAASAAAVVCVYGLWGGAGGVGTGIIYMAMSSGFYQPTADYVAVAGAIAWNAALVAWTVFLFR
jgi:hypothetical protein